MDASPIRSAAIAINLTLQSTQPLNPPTDRSRVTACDLNTFYHYTNPGPQSPTAAHQLMHHDRQTIIIGNAGHDTTSWLAGLTDRTLEIRSKGPGFDSWSGHK